MPAEWLTIVGIGEDGYDGLASEARAAVDAAHVLVGSTRHLAHVPPSPAQRVAWPSPMLPFVDTLVTQFRDRAVVVLASGDPLVYGIGSVLTQRLAAGEYRVLPHVSAFALACARLGWPQPEVTLISAVARPLETLAAALAPARRIVVYTENGEGPGAVAALLCARGYGRSAMTVLERLGSPAEARRDGIAASWDKAPVGDLNVVAIACATDDATQPLATSPGLPDDAYETDGALTKREVRAVTLARLVPLPGQLLWDVGAGSGSIGIEWMRVHPACRAVAVERDGERAARIARNALQLGVPGLRIERGAAPAVLAGLPAPDAVFIGGGLGTDGLVEACWKALVRGGRLVANAVTVDGESVLAQAHARFGGDLVRLSVARAEPIGALLSWRPHMPITQFAVTKR